MPMLRPRVALPRSRDGTLDLRTPTLQTTSGGVDADSPTGAPAAFALLAFSAGSVGVLAGALLF
jgi:hypothetical protein